MATTNKPSMDYLADISKILNEEIGEPIAPNEFTAEMFKREYEKKHGHITTDAVSSRLARMVGVRKATKRKITIKGTMTNVYKLIK